MNKKIDNHLLITKRLKLKTIDINYSKNVLSYQLENKSFFEPWVPSYSKRFFSLSYQEKRLKQDISNRNNGLGIKFWLFNLNNEREIIGDLSISNIVRGSFLSCHIGYKISEKENGKGYITEAIKEAVNFSFNKLLLHRIEANIMPRNIGSIKVVQKIGFHEEGLAKKYLKINGSWEDHIHFVLLNNKIE